ncbi:TetR/AcrR family transcriptional regulator [Geodermatophilus maliterrae]|uniref:TetR/AcrR family transcriptional regulator n=1 Tax=Geodermatophilus maliterrae TaxID=3162531 RepID=A0ABV3XLJ7_9ACTN
MNIDHRTLPRRRGRALEDAILTATLAELAEVGYAGLTMERVADRASASKASVYRRWPSRIELVLDAVRSTLPDPASTPDTGSLRGDLLALLHHTAKVLAGPSGEALRGLFGDALSDPGRTAELRRHSHGTGRAAMTEVLTRAVAREEVHPSAVTPVRLDVGPTMLRQYFFVHGSPIPGHAIDEIVHQVLLPLFACPDPQASVAEEAPALDSTTTTRVD